MNFLDKLKSVIPGMPNEERPDDDDTIHVDGSNALDPNTLSKLASDETTSIDVLLQALSIEKTFEIEQDVLFPGDLDGTVFSKQTPAGYDMSEVDHMISKADNSFRRYVDLLQQRNHDIHKLATHYLKLQAENNNLKLNNELGNGISIMTSGGEEEDFESQLAEARLKISQLQEENNKLKSGGAAVPQDVLADLRKRLDASETARAAAERDASDYLDQIAEMEDEYGIKSSFGDGEDSSAALGDSAELLDSGSRRRDFDPFQNRREESLPDSAELPDIDLDEVLGEQSTYVNNDGHDSRFENSAFTEDQYMNLDEYIDENIVDSADDEGGLDFKFPDRTV